METKVQSIKESVKKRENELFDLACQIFDHPEIGGSEFFAAKLLTDYLEQNGFQVERGIADLPTAFRATWEKGEGGPTIGFCVEYDALPEIGHGCGHHMQGPAGIGAALALKELTEKPVRIVVYGTPDEEGLGGKVLMAEKGCFSEVDVMFAYHSSVNTRLSDGSRALAPVLVTFRGTPSHASSSPHLGRSALDAMMLAFHGLEIMREHVKDGCRIHYTIPEGTGAVNVVHPEAKARITLRSYDKHYLDEMKRRMENVVKGACLMTDTTAEFKYLPEYWNYLPLEGLRVRLNQAAALCGAENFSDQRQKSGGSSDVGNVSWVCPTAYFYVRYSDAKGHSPDYLIEGKSEAAKKSIRSASEIFALCALELLDHPEEMQTIRHQHNAAVEKK